MLHITKRARPDVEPTVAFLCTRVSKSTEEDWLKLKRLMRYINSTLSLVRIIGASSLRDLHTFVDAAYAVHPDMKSHTGGGISMGYGMLHCKSSKQKLNTKSSTEAELVGVGEYLPYNIWLVNFLKVQGYDLTSNTLYQDNQSAIRMERNGRNSCTGNSRHVDIKYFFVKDRIDRKEVFVQYCPTHKMLADYFTKPLQGALFRYMRDIVMGHEDIHNLKCVAKPSFSKKTNFSENVDVVVPSDHTKTEKTKLATYAEAVRSNLSVLETNKEKAHKKRGILENAVAETKK